MYILRLKTWSAHTHRHGECTHSMRRRQLRRRGRHRRRTHFHGVWLWILTHSAHNTHLHNWENENESEKCQNTWNGYDLYDSIFCWMRVCTSYSSSFGIYVCLSVCVRVCVCKKDLTSEKKIHFCCKWDLSSVCVFLLLFFVLHEMFFRCKRKAHRHSSPVSFIHILLYSLFRFEYFSAEKTPTFFSVVIICWLLLLSTAKYFESAKQEPIRTFVSLSIALSYFRSCSFFPSGGCARHSICFRCSLGPVVPYLMG